MSTVARLLRERGGIPALAMDGFLAKLIAFIDANSACLLGTNLYLTDVGIRGGLPHRLPFSLRRFDEVAPQDQQSPAAGAIVNLERFIGVMAAVGRDSGGP